MGCMFAYSRCFMDVCRYSMLIQGSAQSAVVCLLRPGLSDQCRTGLFGRPIGYVYLCTGLITRKRREAELLRS